MTTKTLPRAPIKRFIERTTFIGPDAILVFRGKNEERYFRADSEAAIKAACLKMVKDRVADEWYFAPEEPNFGEPLSEAEIGELRIERLKSVARTYNKEIATAHLDWEKEMVLWNTIALAIDENDAGAALTVVIHTRDWEYMYYEVVEFEKVDR